MKAIHTIIASALMGWAAAGQAAPAEIGITRLDCGTILVRNLNLFSDTQAYTGKTKELSNGCYLVRHGEDYLLWDTGLPAAMKGKPAPEGPFGPTLTVTLREQLAQLKISPERIRFVGISHYHLDHIGQAAEFPQSTLLIGTGDWAVLTSGKAPPSVDPAPLTPWISGGAKVEPVQGDKDVFGDGLVVMLTLPGHTPGHHALLVRLKEAGPVLLSGDVAHFSENYATNGVPVFNVDRADSLASLDRFKALAANLKATVIIQHEPGDVAKLPAFPKEAR